MDNYQILVYNCDVSLNSRNRDLPIECNNQQLKLLWQYASSYLQCQGVLFTVFKRCIALLADLLKSHVAKV